MHKIFARQALFHKFLLFSTIHLSLPPSSPTPSLKKKEFTGSKCVKNFTASQPKIDVVTFAWPVGQTPKPLLYPRLGHNLRCLLFTHKSVDTLHKCFNHTFFFSKRKIRNNNSMPTTNLLCLLLHNVKG